MERGAISLPSPDLCCEESNQVTVVNKAMSQSVQAIFDLQMRKCIGLLYIVPIDWISGALSAGCNGLFSASISSVCFRRF